MELVETKNISFDQNKKQKPLRQFTKAINTWFVKRRERARLRELEFLEHYLRNRIEFDDRYRNNPYHIRGGLF